MDSILKSNFDRAAKLIREKYVHVDRFLSVTESALEAGTHVILFGPGGYGKSKITEEFLKLFYEKDPFITSFDPHMDPSRVFGNTIVKTVSIGDSQMMSFEHDPLTSFTHYRGVIFEEMGDGPPSILASLKDTLTRGRECTGKICYPMATQLIFGCTNVSPKEWVAKAQPADKLSREALLQRFLYQIEMVWPDHSADSYREMFKKQGIPVDDTYIKVLEKLGGNGQFVSPRTAIKLHEPYKRFGLSGLNNANVDKDLLLGLATFVKRQEELQAMQKAIADITELKSKDLYKFISKGKEFIEDTKTNDVTIPTMIAFNSLIQSSEKSYWGGSSSR